MKKLTTFLGLVLMASSVFNPKAAFALEDTPISLSSTKAPLVDSKWNKSNSLSGPYQDIIYTSNDSKWKLHGSLSHLDKDLIGATMVGTILVFTAEKEALEFVQKNDGRIADRLSRSAEKFGSNIPFMLLSGGYVAAAIIENEQLKDVMLIGMQVGLVTSLVNDALKLTFRRALPRETSDPFAVSKYHDAPAMGMPSGHASQAFAMATYLAETFGKENKVIPVLAYGTAALTAWSRVYTNTHWVSDVLVGALVGHLVAKTVMQQSDSNNEQKNIVITPYFTKNKAGIQLQIFEKVKNTRLCGQLPSGIQSVEGCLNERLNSKN